MHKLGSKLLAVPAAVLIASLCAEAARGQTSATPAAGANLQVRINQLIHQLGDPQFAVRQDASRQLQEIGLEAKEPLAKALSSPDAEVRYRAQRILVHVLEADFVARLDTFVLDTDPGKSYGLPCWDAFRKIGGDSPTARQFYVDMVRAEPLLLEMAQREPQRALDALQRRCDSLIGAANRNSRGGLSAGQQPRLSTARMAALLFCHCLPDATANDAVGMKISQLFHQSRLVDEVSANPADHPARRLLGAWIERCADSNLAFQSIWLGMRFELPQALAPAKNLLKRAEQQPYVRQMAILTIGKLGSQSDVAALEPLLTDAASCNPSEQEKTTYRCEVRDVALAAIIYLHGRDPKDFGFAKIQKNPQTLFAQNTMGFSDSAQRTASVSRWKAWLAQHPTSDKAPARQAVTQTAN